MKATNALTKMRRVGSVKIDNENGRNKKFTLTGETHELTVNTQGDDAIIFTVRRLKDHSDSMTDYFAGASYRNFKGALEGYLDREMEHVLDDIISNNFRADCTPDQNYEFVKMAIKKDMNLALTKYIRAINYITSKMKI